MIVTAFDAVRVARDRVIGANHELECVEAFLEGMDQLDANRCVDRYLRNVRNALLDLASASDSLLDAMELIRIGKGGDES